MAWKELLEQQNTQRERRTEADDAPKDRGGLIALACGGIAQSADEADARECIRLPDGYLRRSPPQPYLTPPDYARKRMRKVITAAAVLCLAALLVLALLKSGLIRFN